MKPILQLAFLTLIGCPALNAASTELEILLEPPPIYVLEAPYVSRVDSLPRVGDRVRPTLADLGNGTRVARLTSSAIAAAVTRLNTQFGQITEALYEQRFYSHADEYELNRWLLGKNQLSRDAEKLILESARTNCHFDNPFGEPVTVASRALEIIGALKQRVVPEGAARTMMTDLMQNLRDLELGPYKSMRVREELLDACITALKSSRMVPTQLSDRLVPLVQVDPYRQQYLEINSQSFIRGPLPGLTETPVIFQRLSGFEPKVIQRFVDYWEMSSALGVFTRQDRAFFSKATRFTDGGLLSCGEN